MLQPADSHQGLRVPWGLSPSSFDQRSCDLGCLPLAGASISILFLCHEEELIFSPGQLLSSAPASKKGFLSIAVWNLLTSPQFLFYRRCWPDRRWFESEHGASWLVASPWRHNPIVGTFKMPVAQRNTKTPKDFILLQDSRGRPVTCLLWP